MEDGRFEVETRDGRQRIMLAVRGEIDLATAPEGCPERPAGWQAGEAAAGDVWVDLNEVSFMDSTG